MKIKVYLPYGHKIVTIYAQDSIKKIAARYPRWEYVL